jgi:predicted glycogen debranching enzyme
MISLPGLLTVRGKQDVAQRILSGFLSHLDRGLIPNRFPDAGESPEYNTADGTLWMFPAAWSLRGHSGSKQFLRDVFYPAAREILDWHRRGTHFEIRVDERDQLLSAGTAGTQLTWMDAKVGDWVVTPRHGKPVEINALWYNALRMTQHWAQEYGDTNFSEELRHQAELHRVSFEAQFWNAGRGCLFDRIAPEGPDARIRPNQVFALSLPFPLMNDGQQRMILDLITARLATPFGLRTLEREDPEYRGRYQGGPLERDGAYHQGTVWPWLMGPYVSARLHVYGRGEANVRECRRLVEGLAGQLNRKCLGQLAEIYDGDAPQRPVGAVAQAWSVAELLRVLAQLAC